MSASRIIESEDGSITVEFDGSQVVKHWKDKYLEDALTKAEDAYQNEDLFERANLIFSHINNAIRRHYSGQEFMLKKVVVWEDGRAIKVSR